MWYIYVFHPSSLNHRRTTPHTHPCSETNYGFDFKKTEGWIQGNGCGGEGEVMMEKMEIKAEESLICYLT
ncbi:hypothetical protein YC2023_050113 [Brassica napus]